MRRSLQRDMQRRGGVQRSACKLRLPALRRAPEAEARRAAHRVLRRQPERTLQALRTLLAYYVLL